MEDAEEELEDEEAEKEERADEDGIDATGTVEGDADAAIGGGVEFDGLEEVSGAVTGADVEEAERSAAAMRLLGSASAASDEEDVLRVRFDRERCNSSSAGGCRDGD